MKKIVTFLFLASMIFGLAAGAFAADALTCWFPPEWKAKGPQAKAITDALTKGSGVNVSPRIANSYPEILKAFSAGEPSLVYVGSFVQAMINARNLGVPLVQNIDGKEFYSGVMVYPKGKSPEAILKDSPTDIAFAVGASSGESSAKAATDGKASIGVANHAAAAGAVVAGKAKAAVVKNWWWDANSAKFPTLDVYRIPGVSEEKNPDNVLTASNSVKPEIRKKIADAAIAGKEAFGAPQMVPFDVTRVQFSVELMKKGKIDPLTYSW